jgi:glycosyltransferase involved in cell wall biosynthesis
MRPLRIGVNALYLIPGGVGGTEIYLRQLLTAMANLDTPHEFLVFTNLETGPDLIPRHGRFRQVPQAVKAAVRPARILWEQSALPVAVMNHRVDVLLNPGFTAPILSACPQVTVFHDLQHKRQPENFRWFDLPAWQFLLRASAMRSRVLLADSEETARDLDRFYGMKAPRVRVAPLGVDPRFFEVARRRFDGDYLLSASTLHPHKNLDGLLRAFAQFRQESNYRLVITGVRGFFTSEIEAMREKLGLQASVELTGWIERERLYDLFAGARAFFYPTRFEGFGLPVVEAMAAGIPLACSNIEPVCSLAGDAAVLFDPDDPEALLQAMRTVTLDECVREKLRKKGPERAKQFSWERTARITLDALVSAAGG